MRTRILSTVAIICLLLLGACSRPASDATPDQSMEENGAMSNGGNMAEEDHTMDEAVSADETMTDTMMHDEMAGDMNSSEMMTDTHTMTETMTDTMAHDEMMGEGEMMTDTHAMTETMSGEMMHDDAMMTLPAWQTMALTNARTGAVFTLADFADKYVFVETMATWCPNCRQQLGNVKSAAASADGEQIVFIAISVETDLSAETLAQYADNNGFDWTFVVATPELVRALAATFGPTVANPPATPHFWIYPDGSHGDLVTGFESGETLLGQVGS